MPTIARIAIVAGSLMVTVAAADATVAGHRGPKFASWSDARHGFATDPLHLRGGRVRWRCTPPRMRPGRTDLVLCATNDGGEHWRRSYRMTGRNRITRPFLGPVLRWSARDGVVAEYVRSELYPGHWGADAGELVTHDGGRHWRYTAAFLGDLDRDCIGGGPARLRACRVVSLSGHAPGALRYGLRVCDVETGCSTRFYRLEGWPDGPLRAVPDER